MHAKKERPAKKQMLPLSVWAVVVLIAVLLVLLLANISFPGGNTYRNLREVSYATYLTRLHNLEKDQPRQPGEYRVVIFGSSLTEHAVAADTFFSRRFQEIGKTVSVNRIFYAGANYEMLEDEDFRDFLLTLQPDLLCLEDQVFLYTPLEDLIWQEPMLTEIHKNFVFNADRLKHRLLPAFFPEPGIARNIDSSATFTIPHPRADSVISPSDSTNFKVETRQIRPLKATRDFNQTLKLLQERGTEVAILHLPRPGRIEKDYLSANTRLQRDQLISEYRELVNVQFWQFEQPLPFKYYWDVSHLNKYGQGVYSEWLFVTLEEHF